MSGFESMPYHELIALASRQHQLIEELQATVEHQSARIAELQDETYPGRRRKRKGAGADTLPAYAGLSLRVETILRLAETEAADLRKEAQQAVAALVAEAEREAAQIRADAEAEASAIRTRAAQAPLRDPARGTSPKTLPE